ncbi:hypothetical protein T31B1_02235 [Salinisphaera sp. T31B1]
MLGTTIAVPMLFSAMPALAQGSQQDQMQQLRDQIRMLQQKVDDMAAQQDAAQARQQARSETDAASQTAIGQADKEPADGFKVGNTTVKLNGYLKFDAVYDFEDDHGASLGPSDAIATLNAKGTDHPGDGNIGATVKQTRLKLSTTTETETFGEIGGYIEMDFYGDNYSDAFGDGPDPRVRRAYLTVGNFLIGRDWSTFSDFNYGTTLNFYGPQAQLFERQAQVRYTFDMKDAGTLDVALETPTGDGVENGLASDDGSPYFQSNQTGNEDSPLPDFAIRYQGSQGPVSFQVAGIARYLKADIQGFNGADDNGNDTTFGWGLDVGATWSLPTGTTLMGTVAGGEGIGKYIYAPAGGADTYINNNGELEAFQRWGYIATISQELTSELTGNVIWGQAFSENPNNVSYSTAAFHDNSDTLAVNLLYTPVDPLTLGIEYNRAFYEQQDGVDATAQNVQFSTIYNF